MHSNIFVCCVCLFIAVCFSFFYYSLFEIDASKCSLLLWKKNNNFNSNQSISTKYTTSFILLFIDDIKYCFFAWFGNAILVKLYFVFDLKITPPSHNSEEKIRFIYLTGFRCTFKKTKFDWTLKSMTTSNYFLFWKLVQKKTEKNSFGMFNTWEKKLNEKVEV